MSNEEKSQTDEELEAARRALAQYQAVLGHLQYENSTYWTRSGFISVAQSALLGFYANLLVDDKSDGFRKSAILVGISMVGFFLALVWESVASRGDWWIKRWTDVLLQLEEKAFGETQVFRGVYKRAAASGPTNSEVVRTPIGHAESGLRRFQILAAWWFGGMWLIGFVIAFLVYDAPAR